jgi:hypothetical protein
MTNLETTLRRAYAAEPSPVSDAQSLLDGARREVRSLRRRRHALVALGAAIVVTFTGFAGHLLSASSTTQESRVPSTQVPLPAGPELTVYQFATSAGIAKVVSYLDTRGRWCIGTVQANAARPSGGDYQCAAAGLTPGASGFGRVATRTDGFTYDGVSQWMQGVATRDVARVTVAMTDGSTRTAQLVHDADGVVFSIRISWLKTPAFYRAYDRRGHLIEQLRVPDSVPHDPFVDWRLASPTQ